MRKQYIEEVELLEVGYNHISKHLGWLLRAMISTTTRSTDAVASIVYNKNLPTNIWGLFYGPTRSIAINLEHHFSFAFDAVQNAEHMHTSIRAILLHDLLDSCAHEAWHAKTCLEDKDWEDGSLDEEGAKEYARLSSWEIAELWDVDLDSFGPVIDELLHSTYKSLKEDVQEADCKEWKKIQYHMLENEINYYNPTTGVEIASVREVFCAQCRPDLPWVDVDNSLFSSFVGLENADTKTIMEPAPKPEVLPVEEAAQKPEVTTTPVTSTISPEVAAQPTTTLGAVEPVAEGYDPMDDISCDMGNPYEDEPYVAPAITQAQTTLPVTPQQQPATVQSTPATAPVNQADALRVQQIAEKVLRRMFHHVYSKCEFNVEGGYNNPNAVLDPINISDIEGANELFVEQDTLNEVGTFAPRQPINGFIKGLPTDKGLPRYTFYLKIGNELHKRVYLAQNPDTMKNGAPSKWATAAKNGTLRMMLLATGKGVTAYTKLAAGQTIGQEEFVIWNKK